jgi:surface polysaccharide O-acyltransferase-like enzyme
MRGIRLRGPELSGRQDASSPRRFEVDLVKATGIAAVVLIHSMRPFFSADASAVELWLGSATRFAVPGFLVASGVLYATAKPVPSSLTRARLRRLLVPYLLASLAAQLFWLAFDGRALSARVAFGELLLASSFGPFYYVLHAVLFVLAAPLLARLGARALAAGAVAAIVAQWIFWAFVLLPLFWMVRNPLHWLGFFVAGWWFQRNEAAIVPWLARHRRAVAGLAGLAAALALALENTTASLRLSGSLAWLYVACVLSLVFAVGVGRETKLRAVRSLSDATYTIYLFHLFFVYPVQRLLPPAPRVFEPIPIAAAWLAGLLGPLLIAALGRALLGSRSRALLGS